MNIREFVHVHARTTMLCTLGCRLSSLPTQPHTLRKSCADPCADIQKNAHMCEPTYSTPHPRAEPVDCTWITVRSSLACSDNLAAIDRDCRTLPHGQVRRGEKVQVRSYHNRLTFPHLDHWGGACPRTHTLHTLYDMYMHICARGSAADGSARGSKAIAHTQTHTQARTRTRTLIRILFPRSRELTVHQGGHIASRSIHVQRILHYIRVGGHIWGKRADLGPLHRGGQNFVHEGISWFSKTDEVVSDRMKRTNAPVGP